MLIANARMYAITPDATAAWDDLFRWLVERTGVGLKLFDYPLPQPLYEMRAQNDTGCVFMCGWPFGQTQPPSHLLVVPAPSPERFLGRPISFTDLIVRAESAFQEIEDTFGHQVAWTKEDPHSGFNAPRHYLLQFCRPDRPTVFDQSVGPVINPMGALRSVVEGEADVAPVDAFVHDLFNAADHELTRQTRTIASTPPTPFPPLVASPDVDPDIADRLREALSSAHDDADIRPVLGRLLIERFVVPEVADYALGVKLGQEALSAGYPMPARGRRTLANF